MTAHRIANVLAVSNDSDLLTTFGDKLTRNNYRVETSSPDNVVEKAIQERPDLIVVDTSAEDASGFALIKGIKEHSQVHFIPVVALVEKKTKDLYDQAIAAHADDIFIHSFDIEEFFVHIKPLLRLSTMFLELENRVALTRKMGGDAQNDVDKVDDSGYRILLVAPQDGDKAAVETVLGGNCIIDVCPDFFAAEDQLEDNNYDAAICSISVNNRENALSLSSRARNNPRLFNLPVLLINDGSLENRLEAYRRGVTRITNRPLNQSSLQAKIKMLVRRQRLRWNIRKALDSTKNAQTTDAHTQAYTKDFFEANLSLQIANAQKWQKHLTVVFFTIGNLANAQEQFGEGPAQELRQQVHQWIASLSRAEDTVALYKDNQFAVALPDTPEHEAQLVMHRIAGILSYTDFAISEVYQPLSVWVECAIAHIKPNDDASALIARAHQNIS